MSAPLILALSRGSKYELFECTGVPVVEPGLIVVSAMGSAATQRQAEQLVDELKTVVIASAPEARVASLPTQPATPSDIEVFSEPHRRKVLALVCDSTKITSQSWFKDWTATDAVDMHVAPIFKEGSQPSQSLPTEFRPFNAEFWTQSITEVVPAILSSAGITLEHRVFISYRRLETQPMAQQLFDRLTRAGFDVFLDRFSIESGVNFQQRLFQELLDKSMVIFLESANIDNSKWTQEEIAFTKRYRLGLLALTLPDRGDLLKSIDPDQRLSLKRDQFKDSGKTTKVPNPKPRPERGSEPDEFNQWPELKPEALEEVVAVVKRIHDVASFRRRREVRENAMAVLKTVKGVVPSEPGNDGIIQVTVTDTKGQTRVFGLWLTTRPPDFVDFHSTYVRGGEPPAWKGVICGPADVLERSRRDKLKWMATVSGYGCFDLAELEAVAERMYGGTL